LANRQPLQGGYGEKIDLSCDVSGCCDMLIGVRGSGGGGGGGGGGTMLDAALVFGE